MGTDCCFSSSSGPEFRYWSQRTDALAHRGHRRPLLSPWAHNNYWRKWPCVETFMGGVGGRFVTYIEGLGLRALCLFSWSTLLFPVSPGSSNEQLCHLSHCEPVIKWKFWIHGVTITFMATDCSIVKQYGDDFTLGGRRRGKRILCWSSF